MIIQNKEYNKYSKNNILYDFNYKIIILFPIYILNVFKIFQIKNFGNQKENKYVKFKKY